ncbi:MAG: chromosomal replication initiator protein DnaA [Actinobacteria bacterium]|jgi:chromosomal replication initiator protein|nr:chromosomal replication initiator protein DnaA [Actinomycetota bacterium]
MVEEIGATIVNGYDNFWKKCTNELRSRVGDSTWRAWLSSLQLVSYDEQSLTLMTHSSIVRERVQTQFTEKIQETVEYIVGIKPTINIIYNPLINEKYTNYIEQLPSVKDSEKENSNSSSYSSTQSGLQSRYTFDTFVIGSSNRFAHAAALAVAESPAHSYNPLFIHGGAGLGKTHLLHAIGNYTYQNTPLQTIRYVSTETFMNEFVDAIRNNKTTDFKKHYRECDILLIDDVQFLEGKEALQEEFFHTFNSLYDASKQVVLTSDRPPKALTTLENRLRSRFLSGLITDIQAPDLETRMAILRQKASRDNLNIPDEILTFIASNITDNIRELEGALLRISAYINFNNQPITMATAQTVLHDIVPAENPRVITPDLILRITANTFGYSVEDLVGFSRRRPLVTARQICMYVFRELTDYSYPAIAREFGGRDHTTVIHAVERIATLMKQRRSIYNQVTDLIQTIKSHV